MLCVWLYFDKRQEMKLTLLSILTGGTQRRRERRGELCDASYAPNYLTNWAIYCLLSAHCVSAWDYFVSTAG
jgi:hypothetical protein